MRRVLGVVAVVLILVTAGCVSAPAPAGPTATQEPSTASPSTQTTPTEPPQGDPSPTDDPPPDPKTDPLGWEDGYWHNETLDIDPTDGLNRSELDAVVARGMARVEATRGLEFEKPINVRIIDRAEFRNQSTGGRNSTTAQRLHQDVKFEALLFIGEGASAISQQEENRAEGVLGYYAPGDHNITIVSDSGPPLQMDEVTLAQELFHAVQEEHFSVSNRTSKTEEERNANLGIIEGDGNYVDYLYEQRYAEDLVTPSVAGGSGSGGDRHIGLFALRFQPYSDGPPFVQGIREETGWAGVNEVYDNYPESSEQTIHPEKYLVDDPVNVTIDDRSSEQWTVPDQGEGHIDYAEFGEPGLYAMLWYPSYEATSEGGTATDVVIPYRHFFQTAGQVDAYNYSHPVTTGWEGDRLLPYVRADSADTNETGYVWRIEWETVSDATEFRDAYVELLSYHGGMNVAGSESVYRIQEGPFADAFAIRQDGTTVTIVNAPTVEELDAVHNGAR
ncbi:Hvo_1808 family surface protein [Halodesulfurarchaeum sp.]|uniref:Hvo_1808 family surface protein n=1 Tax=Halodesulfurarchaeum sp. TaxID=1980530 RepID=UPI002FC32CC5